MSIYQITSGEGRRGAVCKNMPVYKVLFETARSKRFSLQRNFKASATRSHKRFKWRGIETLAAHGGIRIVQEYQFEFEVSRNFRASRDTGVTKFYRGEISSSSIFESFRLSVLEFHAPFPWIFLGPLEIRDRPCPGRYQQPFSSITNGN